LVALSCSVDRLTRVSDDPSDAVMTGRVTDLVVRSNALAKAEETARSVDAGKARELAKDAAALGKLVALGRSEATANKAAALAKDPDLKGVFATNLFSAQGVATGIRQAGKSGKVKVVGFDAGPDQIKQLKAGQVQALVAQKPYDIGVQGIDQAVASLTGKPVTKNIATASLIVTKANLSVPSVNKYIYKSSC